MGRATRLSVIERGLHEDQWLSSRLFCFEVWFLYLLWGKEEAILFHKAPSQIFSWLCVWRCRCDLFIWIGKFLLVIMNQFMSTINFYLWLKQDYFMFSSCLTNCSIKRFLAFKCSNSSVYMSIFFYILYNSLVQLVQYSWSCPAPVPSGIWWRAKEPRSYLSPTLHLSVLATSHLANDPSVSGRVAVSRDSCIFSHAQIEASGLVLICESTTIFSQGRGHRGLAAESRVLKWNISNRSKILRK